MNTLAAERYSPPSRSQPLISTGLATLVHVLLAALLLWGFRWEIPQPRPVQVELWSAPAREVPRSVRQPQAPAARPTPQPVPEPDTVAAAEINRRVAEKPAQQPVKKPDQKETERKKSVVPDKSAAKAGPKVNDKATEKPAARAIPQPTDEDEVHSGDSAAKGTAARNQDGAINADLQAQYHKQVAALIVSNVLWPPDGSNPVARVRIRLLSNLVMIEPEVVKQSGNPQWDNAVVKAILITKKLPPLPPGLRYGPDMRTITFNFCPKEC